MTQHTLPRWRLMLHDDGSILLERWLENGAGAVVRRFPTVDVSVTAPSLTPAELSGLADAARDLGRALGFAFVESTKGGSR